MLSENRIVGKKESAECWVLSAERKQWAVGSGQWAVGKKESAECWVLSAERKQWAVGSRQSAVGSWQLAMKIVGSRGTKSESAGCWVERSISAKRW